jgi:prolyl-tRNA synthetase
MARVLTPQAEDFPRWYQDVLAKAELAENGPVRGTMVIRPYGYSLWERMQSEVDDRIKAAGAKNAYFPLFIPESYLKKEAQHVEGFSPELAVVTIGGGKVLEEPIVVRPTSETIINASFAKWVQSYRDLPLLINQWANVVRWEMRPRLLLRTTEFLWQEGHTAHATEQEARDYARQILRDVYEDFVVDVLGLPVVVGRKTARERFAGATNTMTMELMTRDGKALQMGTSHELGQNFAKAFGIEFLAPNSQREYAWQTSWGSSTRMLGGLVMAHGDDNGLRVPPRLAPTQVAVVVIKAEATEAAVRVADELRSEGIRVELDDRADIPFGRRAVDWELKGVPLRVEIGPRDLAEERCMLVRRIPGSKTPTPLAGLLDAVRIALVEDQVDLYDEAERFRDARIADVKTIEDAVEACATGWARLPWAELGTEGEAKLAERSVTVRCLVRADGWLPETGDEPDTLAYCARAY